MKINDLQIRWLILGLVTLLLAPILVGSALAQCTYTPLVSGVSQMTTSTPWQYYTINQTETYWAAIGVRAVPGDAWDIGAYQDPDVSPGCVTNMLAQSTPGSLVNFVIGDFNVSSGSIGTYYIGVERIAGTMPVPVEWDDGTNQLVVNDEPEIRSTDATDVLTVWDVFLEAGVTYEFRFQATGSAVTKILLFEPPTASPYWLSRNQSMGEWSTDFSITAPTTNWYAVVVVNDDGGTGSYEFNVVECDNKAVLASGVSDVPAAWQNYYEFNQVNDYWTAIGYRRVPGDVDLSLYSQPSGGGSPICLGNYLTGGVQPDSGLVFFVGDFNGGGISTGAYYARAELEQPGEDGRVQWDSGPDQFNVDALPVYRTIDEGYILETWDVYLESSNSYSANFNVIGDAWPRMYLFRRNAIKEWQDAGDAYYWTDGTGYFTPPVDGWYGLVVASLDGGSGEYSLSITTCENYGFLASNASPVTTYGPSDNLGFVQQEGYWSAVGVRSPATSDWDLELYEFESGGLYPVCQSGLLAVSDMPIAPPVVDFVVGDFNHNPWPRAYYLRTAQFSGSDDGAVQWDGGEDIILANDDPTYGYTGAGEILKVWDVFMEGGQDYHIFFDRGGDADAKLFLFNSHGGVYWGNRASADLVTESSVTYSAPDYDFYGLVVVNDNGLDGNYSLGVYTAGTPVETVALPTTTSIRSIAPNPARGSAAIHFDLNRAGIVSFEVLNVAGRVVSRISDEHREAGVWTVNWSGRSSLGTNLAAGVYFIRMRLDEQVISHKKLVLLD
jgi:hypothetical protein